MGLQIHKQALVGGFVIFFVVDMGKRRLQVARSVQTPTQNLTGLQYEFHRALP